jgi:hypothetical protein
VRSRALAVAVNDANVNGGWVGVGSGCRRRFWGGCGHLGLTMRLN